MWTLLLLAVTVVSTRISVNPHMLVVLSDRRMDVVEDGRSNVEVAQSLLVRSRMSSNASITKALLCIAPKAGTTSILEWFIQLSAGESYKSCRSKLLKAKIKTRQQIGYLHVRAAFFLVCLCAWHLLLKLANPLCIGRKHEQA